MSETTHGQNSFERAHNMLELPDARKTTARTVNIVQPLLGLAASYIVQTIRRPNESGWTVLLTIVSGEGTYRHVLPNEVCEAIHSQRERLLGPVRAPKPRLTAEQRRAKEEADARKVLRDAKLRRKAANSLPVRGGGA